MDESELDKLVSDVEEIKRAVRRNNPFVRELVGGRFFAALGLPFGLLIVGFCAGAQLLLERFGSVAGIPAGWKAAGWAALAAVFIGGGILKWGFLGARARKVQEGATVMTIFRGVYGGPLFHLNLPVVICMVAATAFAVSVGHPWYIVPGIGIFFAFISNALGLAIGRPEYLVAGWYCLASSLASLFFMEAAPLVWSAVIWGGCLLVFGIVGLAVKDREAPA
jgi:hypothetical protein